MSKWATLQLVFSHERQKEDIAILAENRFALIVEDEVNVALIFSKALEMANLKTEIVHDGKIASERLSAIIPNLVVLDLHLPGVSGIDILDQIRADERLTETKVMVVTADLVRAEALQRDADVVLIKPVSVRQLINAATYLCPA